MLDFLLNLQRCDYFKYLPVKLKMKKHESSRLSFGFVRQGQNKQQMLKKCVSIIEQLQLELERVNKINEQQKYLIQILKEGKQYYENECKINTFKQTYLEIKRQNQQLQVLLQAHLKSEDQLKLRVNKVQAQKESFLTTIKEKDQKILQQEQKYMKLLLQKQVVEKEWNKVIRAVKKKISILVANNENNPQRSPVKQFMGGAEKSNEKRQKMDHFAEIKYPKDVPIQKRAQNMVKLIDNMLAAQQLQNILTGDTSTKKVDPKSRQFSQKKVLREIDLNRLEVPFNVQFY